MSGFFFNGSRGLCAGLAESEFHFKQLYFKRSFELSVYAEKIIKFKLQNIPICSSFKKEKKKKKEERKGSAMNIWAKTILFLSVRVFCYVSDCVTSHFLPPASR